MLFNLKGLSLLDRVPRRIQVEESNKPTKIRKNLTEKTILRNTFSNKLRSFFMSDNFVVILNIAVSPIKKHLSTWIRDIYFSNLYWSQISVLCVSKLTPECRNVLTCLSKSSAFVKLGKVRDNIVKKPIFFKKPFLIVCKCLPCITLLLKVNEETFFGIFSKLSDG